MFRLMLITDRTLIPVERLPQVVGAAVREGVDAVQLRAKGMAEAEQVALGRRLREVTRGRAILLVNSSEEVARACGADGVHLPENATPARTERSGLVVGRSVHGLEAARAAEQAGCHYLVLGTIFPSRSHPGESAAGVELVSEVSAAVRAPVIGIGGITADNVGGVIRAGAYGVAVVSAILGSPDIEAAARALRAAVDAATPARSGGCA